MEGIFTSENLISLLTLTLMEVVLGIDNVIFISILTSRLQPKDQQKGRFIGLLMAMVFRIILLFMISWLIHLTQPLFTVFEKDISVKDLILIAGGLFLIYKSITEIYHKTNVEEERSQSSQIKLTIRAAVIQIIILDLVFSIDSIITAIGLVEHLYIMVSAVVISMIIMLAFAKPVGNFVSNNPSVKIIALSFLLMIGTMLLAEGFHIHFPKGYIYFSMAFGLGIELLNMRMRKSKVAPSP